MLTSRCVIRILALGSTILANGPVSGQEFPNKVIRMVTSPPGGQGDFVARLIAHAVSNTIGQQMIVDNRQTPLVPEIVGKAPADGYTLALIGQGFWISQYLIQTSYDPIRDFVPISFTNSSPNILVVHPSLPVKSVKELIALARAKPGQLNYGSSPTGSTPHLAAELFKMMAGVNIVRIGYKGAAQALTDVIAGEVQMTFATAAGVAPFLKAGRLRALAVTSARPTSLAPGLPAVADVLPGYESVSLQSVVAPAKTPPSVVNRLSQEIVRALNDSDLKEKFLVEGTEAYGSSSEEVTSVMKAEMARMEKLIREKGIRSE